MSRTDESHLRKQLAALRQQADQWRTLAEEAEDIGAFNAQKVVLAEFEKIQSQIAAISAELGETEHGQPPGDFAIVRDLDNGDFEVEPIR